MGFISVSNIEAIITSQQDCLCKEIKTGTAYPITGRIALGDGISDTTGFFLISGGT